jgi:hypothetical protein
MQKYPSIKQLRNVVEEVRSTCDFHGMPYPTLGFTGTVKLHGTNAAVVRYKDGVTQFQSREKILSAKDDNYGFFSFMAGKQLDFLFDNVFFDDYAAFYGEWCGGSIQNTVGIAALPKMFVVFGLKVDGKFVPLPKNLQDNHNGIYNIYQFGTYSVDIDFNDPEAVREKLNELTLAVEKECPVAKFFGVIGIGEGVMFACNDMFKGNNESDLVLSFKSKGSLHAVSKTKKMTPVSPESFEDAVEFVDSVATENRFIQGAGIVGKGAEKTRDFISWVTGDILKEEMDLIVDSNLDVKIVKSAIGKKSSKWYLDFISR